MELEHVQRNARQDFAEIGVVGVDEQPDPRHRWRHGRRESRRLGGIQRPRGRRKEHEPHVPRPAFHGGIHRLAGRETADLDLKHRR